jgi:hypothetical protein
LNASIIRLVNGTPSIDEYGRKYLSSPKEASRSAEAAFLGASAMFEELFLGILGCCQVLPSWKPVFIRVSGFL